MQRKAAATAEKDGSITSAATLIDGTPLTPQQLGKFFLKYIYNLDLLFLILYDY